MSPTAYIRERAALRLQIARLLPSAGPGILTTALLTNLVAGLAPVAFVVATSAVVGRVPAAVDGGLGSPAWHALRTALLAAGALFVVVQVLSPVQWAVGELLTWRIDDGVRDRIADASLGTVGVAQLEDPATLAELAQIVDPNRGVGFTPGAACNGLASLVTRYSQWLAASILLGVAYTWWAAVATAVGALLVRTGIRSGVGRLGGYEESLWPLRQRRDYLLDLLATPGAAKEVRVFGLQSWLLARFRAQSLEAVCPVWRARRRFFYLPYALTIPVWLVLSGLATIRAARAAAGGDITLGELAFSLQAIVLISALGTFFWELDWAVERGLLAYDAVERFAAGAAADRAASGRADAAGLPRREIRFEGVTFAYGADTPVLQGFELTIPAGRSLAIVGLNGAGKTTLVKLLARLYEPQSGRITVDGVDLRALDPAGWRARLGAIFQDFVRYDLPVRDNVGFGAPALLRDDAHLQRALEGAGAAALVEELREGLETVLSRQYAGGAELSGGQWQRIAIARALMAMQAGAGVLILDEPTANLDVRAETEFFNRFLELTSGLTTILISHRFSTVRRADRIVVLEHGTVREAGTHDELLALGGRYAELFQLQAARFE